jgi:proliferating cell nuclear antigen
MFEARLSKAKVFKQLITSIKDLVSDINLDCSSAGISMPSMDSSHCCLIELKLREDGFDSYRSDKNMTLGVQTSSLYKLVQCSGPDDSLTLQASEDEVTLKVLFESPSGDKVSN